MPQATYPRSTRLPKPTSLNYGISIKIMGKYRYWVARYQRNGRWKTKRLSADNIVEARNERGKLYDVIRTWKSYVPSFPETSTTSEIE